MNHPVFVEVSIATTVELILQFLGVTALTILAERYLSDKAAIGVLVICLVGLGWKHRNWLNESRHEHRVVVVSLSVLIFAFCGLAVGLWVTKQTPASGKDSVGRKDAARPPSSGPLQVRAEGTVTDPSKGLTVKGTGTITPSSTDRATS